MPKVQRYISEELAHFVGRGKMPVDQYSLLMNILRSGRLTHPPHSLNVTGGLSINLNAKLSTNEMYSPDIVCFCDIPIEDLHIHTSKYSRFGFSLSKEFVVRQGGAPVLYLPRNARVRRAHRPQDSDKAHEEIPLGELFDQMAQELDFLNERLNQLIMQTQVLDRIAPEYRRKAGENLSFIKLMPITDEKARLFDLHGFINRHLLSYIKFFDHCLPDDSPDNFYMEREWRVVGNVHFSLGDVKRIFVPSDYAKRLRVDLPDYYGQVTFVG